jgi:ABC-type amino acid transport substrate-binding protein
MRSPRHLLAIGVLGLNSVIATPSASSATNNPAATSVAAANSPLRVVTTPIAPFVLPNTDPLAGFSIDVWN